jgi:hypothetical protein
MSRSLQVYFICKPTLFIVHTIHEQVHWLLVYAIRGASISFPDILVLKKLHIIESYFITFNDIRNTFKIGLSYMYILLKNNLSMDWLWFVLMFVLSPQLSGDYHHYRHVLMMYSWFSKEQSKLKFSANMTRTLHSDVKNGSKFVPYNTCIRYIFSHFNIGLFLLFFSVLRPYAGRFSTTKDAKQTKENLHK